MNALLIIPVFIPILLGILVLILPRNLRGGREGLALFAAGAGVTAALVLFLGGGEGIRWEFSYPALEIRFNLHASQTLGFNLLIVTIMEALILLLAVFAGPQGLRSSETLFFLLYSFGIANGILLSEEYVEMILFGELLFVAIYGVIVLLSLLSSFSNKGTPPDETMNISTLSHWANSRVFSLFGLGITRGVKMFAGLIYVTIDRGIDDTYEKWIAQGGKAVTIGLKAAHNGLYANYLSWVLGGFVLLVWFFAMGAW